MRPFYWLFFAICASLLLPSCFLAGSSSAEEGHDEHGDEHDEHGDEHDEHGDEHDEHGDEHDEHGDEHDEHGEAQEGGHGDHESPEVTLTKTQTKNAGVRTQLLSLRRMASVVEATGEVTFDPDRLVKVASPVAGRVVKIGVVPGTPVKAGGMLAVINSAELGRAKGDYLVAHAAVQLARRNLEREEELAAAKISAGRDLLAARGGLTHAQAVEEGIEETLRGYGMSRGAIGALRPGRHATSTFRLTGPITGSVIERNVSVGEGVETTATLFVVGDTSRVWVRADVLERDLSSVRVGQRATVRTSAFEQTFVGTLSYISPLMEESTRTVRARVEVDNPERLLRPGMFARVEIEVAGDDAAVLTVPEEAVIRREGETFVFFEETPGTFRRVEVVLGRSVGSHFVVTSGLEEGQNIVVDGAFFLQSEIEKAGFEAGHAH